MSRLENLSHIDFEDLCRDIAQAETGYRFSAFGPGADGGIDGRHSNGEFRTVLQCKHYIGSSFSDLKKTCRSEYKKLLALNPGRYILYTSRSLTPAQSDSISSIFGSYIKNPGDIWSQEDIEAAIRRHPEIEKSHLKLWLTSSAVLQRILDSGLEAYTQATKDEIISDLRVYVRNESFEEAAKKLENQSIIVISGPPGVGKTTLAKMLSYHYLNEGWQFCSIRTLDEGFVRLNDEIPTIFFFDDFLGRIKLDRQSLLQRESALATFVRRIKKSKKSRFIMTTRAHIFEEARRCSDYVDDNSFQLAKYLLDVGVYTRKIRAYILFNHLFASKLSPEHVRELLMGDWLKKIIDHKNYNPRVIASASSENLDTVSAVDYPKYLFNALENPDLIWSKPFRELSMRSQNLLIVLFFSSQYGISIDQLTHNFDVFHRKISAHYGQSTSPADFEEALRSLESGFISISGQSVSFVNPSLRDYLRAYLIQREFLMLMPSLAQRADWAREVWQHVKSLFKPYSDIVCQFALAFIDFSDRIEATPTMTQEITNGWVSHTPDDLPMSSRVLLLLEWWDESKNDDFLRRSLEIMDSSSLDVVPWRDGQTLPEIYWHVTNFVPDDNIFKPQLIHAISMRLAEIIDSGLAIDDLISIIQRIKEHMSDAIPEAVAAKLDAAIKYEFEATGDAVTHLDTEGSLSEHIDYLDALSELTGKDCSYAKEVVGRKIQELEEPEHDEPESSISTRTTRRTENFDDVQLRNLFCSMIS